MLRSLWIGSLPAPPPDPSNRFADDPAAAKLGRALFFDARFSGDGTVACASCHQPDKAFTDGKPLADDGMGVTNRRTMTIIGTAYSPWLFWDGRKDSLWAQALGPMESPVEHGGTRTQYARLLDQHYRQEYEALFGPLPDFSDETRFPAQAGPIQGNAEAQAAWAAMTEADREAVTQAYANMGKAIAAYERLINPGPAPFDDYVASLLGGAPAPADAQMTPEALAGLRLFIDDQGARCIRCHNGPLFTNNDFANTGVPVAPGLPPDEGRKTGVDGARQDEFNCLSAYSDAQESDCDELRFAKSSDAPELLRAFKVPTLRNVSERAPYMHAGQFATLAEVLDHYNRAPDAPAGHNELTALNLNEEQLGQLAAFLETLSGPLAVAPEWLGPPAGVED